jgi:hypothetical protein
MLTSTHETKDSIVLRTKLHQCSEVCQSTTQKKQGIATNV